MKRISRVIGISLILLLVYISGIFWLPPDWGGVYLYMSSSNRQDYFASKAGMLEARKSCRQTPGMTREQFNICWTAAYESGKGRYFNALAKK